MRTSTVFRDQLLHSYFDLKTNTEVPYFFQSLHPHPILNHHRTFSYNVHGTETENSMKRKNNAKDGLISVCRRQCEEVRNSPANEISMHYSSIQHSDRMDEDKCILYWAQTKHATRRLERNWRKSDSERSAMLRKFYERTQRSRSACRRRVLQSTSHSTRLLYCCVLLLYSNVRYCNHASSIWCCCCCLRGVIHPSRCSKHISAERLFHFKA